MFLSAISVVQDPSLVVDLRLCVPHTELFSKVFLSAISVVQDPSLVVDLRLCVPHTELFSFLTSRPY